MEVQNGARGLRVVVWGCRLSGVGCGVVKGVQGFREEGEGWVLGVQDECRVGAGFQGMQDGAERVQDGC